MKECLQGSVMLGELDKRKFQRLERPLEVTVRILAGGEMSENPSPLQVKSRNISKCGICLESKSLEIDSVNLLSGLPFARRNRLQVHIELIPAEPPFEATGEVRWYDVISDAIESTYQIGVEFTDLTDADEDRLVRFLETHKDDRGFFSRLFR